MLEKIKHIDIKKPLQHMAYCADCSFACDKTGLCEAFDIVPDGAECFFVNDFFHKQETYTIIKYIFMETD